MTCYDEARRLCALLNAMAAPPQGGARTLTGWAISRMSVLSLLWGCPPSACFLAAAL